MGGKSSKTWDGAGSVAIRGFDICKGLHMCESREWSTGTRRGIRPKGSISAPPGCEVGGPILLRVGLPGRSPDLGFSDETVWWNRATLQKLN